jgi:cytochrome-b5 reductase
LNEPRDAALSQDSFEVPVPDGQGHAHQDPTPTLYPLTAILADTHDTKTFRFALPADTALDMLPGDYLYAHATINGKSVKRPYTPSSLPGIAGFFDLTVKRYETGVMSKHLHDQRVGDTVLMSGPCQGGHWVDGMAKKVGFVAAGGMGRGKRAHHR